jgi:MFS transporter, DHA1 family, multidrug resistance protein
VLPLLPIYLVQRGNGTAMVGAVMSAFFATGVGAQYLSGRIGDRIGHRKVLVAGLLGYAGFSAGFLLPLTGWGALGLRAGQGATAGAAQVACLALVAHAVPSSHRGRAFSAVGGAEIAGIAVGPMLGALLGLAHMGQLFLAGALGAVLACVPVLASRTGAAVTLPGERQPLPRKGSRAAVVRGVMLTAGVGGVTTGAYESCWSLLLHHRGASDFQLGLSWTLFAVPFVVVSPLAGWLADRTDRRRLALTGMVTGFGFAAVYPWLTSANLLLGLGAVEAVGTALAYPAAQAMLADAVPISQVGRAQGSMAGLQTAAIAASTAAGGALYGVAIWLPFVTASAVGALFTGLAAWQWRAAGATQVTGGRRPAILPPSVTIGPES